MKHIQLIETMLYPKFRSRKYLSWNLNSLNLQNSYQHCVSKNFFRKSLNCYAVELFYLYYLKTLSFQCLYTPLTVLEMGSFTERCSVPQILFVCHTKSIQKNHHESQLSLRLVARGLLRFGCLRSSSHLSWTASHRANKGFWLVGISGCYGGYISFFYFFYL